MKKIMLIIMFNIMLLNIAFAHELLNNNHDYSKAYYYTVGEASKITKSGNPMDFVIAYKEEHNNEIPDEFLYPPDGDREDYVGDYENDQSIQRYLGDMRNLIKNNIREGIIPQYKSLNRIDSNKTNLILLIVISLIIFFILILLFLLLHKKIFIVISAIMLVIGIFNIVKMKQKAANSFDSISNYAINNEIDNHLSMNVNSIENKDKLTKYINRKWSIAYFINDYFTRVNACVQLQKNRKKLDRNIYMFRFQEADLENQPNYFSDLPFFKYGYSFEGDNIKFILCNGFSFDDLQILCKNINDDGLENYSKENLFKELNDKLIYSNCEKGERLFQYVKRISNESFITGRQQDYFDNQVISYFKDWYIEGMEDKDIDLPYGVTLHYEAPKFVKKDIKEVLYTNESELDHNSKERQVYVMYYKDSKGELNGTYTDIEFVKTGNDYVVDFNPYELLYDLKKPVAILSIK